MVAAPDNAKQSTLTRNALTALRACAFVILAALLFWYLNVAVMSKGDEQNRGAYKSLYELEDDTVDVLFVGTSAVSRQYISPLAFHENGIAAYDLGVQSSPVYFIDDQIEEARKTQNPKLYIIELRALARPYDEFNDAEMHRTIDSLALSSQNRISMAQDAVANDITGESHIIDYVFPIVKYHGRAIQGELTPEDLLLTDPVNRTQGFRMSFVTLVQTAVKECAFSDELGEIPEVRKKHLIELLEYCKTLDGDVLFVISPYSANAKNAKKFNSVAQVVEDYGFPILNCTTREKCEEIGVNWNDDFYNEYHFNYLGAEKYTRYIDDYIAEHYDLPDRRSDARYTSWEIGYKLYESHTANGIKKRYTSSEGIENQ